MRAFGKSNTGQRSVPRAEVYRTASLATRDEVYSLGLVDLSRTGARLSGAERPEPGQDVFRSHDVKAHAQVVWLESDSCAIEFETPIAPAEVRRLNRM